MVLQRRAARCLLLLALAILGIIGLAPMLLGQASTAAALAAQSQRWVLPWVLLGSMALLGVSFGSTTVTWMLISTDPMCAGAAAAGTVAGAANTICMALDAILQTCFGALLDAFGSGSGEEHRGGERVYSPLAYSRALLLYLAALTAAAAAALYLWRLARREQRRASGACSSPCSEVNERQELLLGR